MAKKLPPPICAVKSDFVDSLDHLMAKALVLDQAISTAFKLGILSEDGPGEVIWKAYEAFHKALFTDE